VIICKQDSDFFHIALSIKLMIEAEL